MRIFTDKGFERYLAAEKEKHELHHFYESQFNNLCNAIDRLEHRVYELEHGQKTEVSDNDQR